MISLALVVFVRTANTFAVTRLAGTLRLDGRLES